MRFLAPPIPSPDTPGGSTSIAGGQQTFANIGCALCHTPTLRTGGSTVAALRDQDVKLFSDLALHQMGPGLADDIRQGEANGDEFRTAPLWGLGQRLFFLHDGRTTDPIEAIQAHKSTGNRPFGPSETVWSTTSTHSARGRSRTCSTSCARGSAYWFGLHALLGRLAARVRVASKKARQQIALPASVRYPIHR